MGHKMSDWNNWQQQQYGYDTPPQPKPKKGFVEKVFGTKLAQKIESPFFATFSILLAGGAFAGVLLATYSGGNQDQAVPVIVAENQQVKFMPDEEGGMSIPHQDSTIFGAVSKEAAFDDARASQQASVENLLEQDPMGSASEGGVAANQQAEGNRSQLEELARASERVMRSDSIEDIAAIEPSGGAGAKARDTAQGVSSQISDQVKMLDIPEPKRVDKVQVERTVESLVSEEDLQAYKQEQARKEEALRIRNENRKKQKRAADKQDEQANQETSELKKSKPNRFHRPGASPETLAFVRSVLDKKDSKKTPYHQSRQTEANTASANQRGAQGAQAQAQNQVQNQVQTQAQAQVQTQADTSSEAAQDLANAVSKIEPAIGPAPIAGNVVGTPYFVQVVSVPTQYAAEQEWGKLQKKYSYELDGQGYRIQEANLGERGLYYRVQVGPFSKQDANILCDSLRAQKPGACLVVR